MSEDLATHVNENTELIKETADLTQKYEDLQKECKEKMQLMTEQMEDSEKKQDSIEQTLTEQIDNQTKQIHEQIQAYKD